MWTHCSGKAFRLWELSGDTGTASTRHFCDSSGYTMYPGFSTSLEMASSSSTRKRCPCGYS